MADDDEFPLSTPGLVLHAGCHLDTPPFAKLINSDHLVFYCSVCETFVGSFELKNVQDATADVIEDVSPTVPSGELN